MELAASQQCQGSDSVHGPTQWVKGSGIVTAAAWVTAMARVQSLAYKLLRVPLKQINKINKSNI